MEKCLSSAFNATAFASASGPKSSQSSPRVISSRISEEVKEEGSRVVLGVGKPSLLAVVPVLRDIADC